MTAATASYETVIGLEVHVQLATHSKAFCGDDASFGGGPNTHVGAISLGHPGTLPMLNRRQVEFAVRLGLALGSRINPRNAFDRKNYFYADLPKGYQITQDRQPVCIGGALEIRVGHQSKSVRIHHIHIEEDAGKSMHDQDAHNSLIDLNRAGVPLLEIVTEPDLRSGEEVDAFMTAMRRLVRYLEISDGNMEQGSMRCDVNVSVRPQGETRFGTRCEVKNLNSMKFARQAIDYETQRQVNLIESGGQVEQNTLHFDPATGITSPLRSKEDAHDYRYFPDPDLPPVVLDEAYIEGVRAQMPPLPQQLFEQFTQQYNLSEYDAALLTEEKPVALYFIELCRHTPHVKAAANLIINKIMPWRDEHKAGIEAYPVSQERLAGMLELVAGGQVSNTAAWQNLLPAMMEKPESGAPELAQMLGLLQTNDESFLSEIIDQALAANPNKVAEYRKGKKGLQGFFMGEIMRLSKGKADPKAATPLLLQKLDAS
ncbi:MAG TPA: Asp-tRNA(Asn)/Glu-tRNA(Gln) amidotransferase subunit GatB [Saprospiraceae bacterium]|nr:Asp-tRNA(Asn)/Glu-tRNA(Gln) amidotransferase subunit GatB [Saprospiraceae bacterium]